MDRVHSALKRSIPTEPYSAGGARLVAELQALQIALHLGGLDGLRTGTVQMGQVSAGMEPLQGRNEQKTSTHKEAGEDE